VLSQLPYPPRLTISWAGGVITVSWLAALSWWMLEAGPSLVLNPLAWI
jgi:hypothetical protein